MTIPYSEFVQKDLTNDPYENIVPVIKTEDLQPHDPSLPIKLSVITSTYHRYSQLQRFLECLCRQDWKEFEVIVCDDGDPRDLEPIFERFRPFLRLVTFRRERKYYRNDPTGAFIEAFKIAKGDYFAITQPEMMFWPDVCRFLYDAHQKSLPNTIVYPQWYPDKSKIDAFNSFELVGDHPTWAAIKVNFLEGTARKVDSVDWHTNMDAIFSIPGFSSDIGFAGRDNNIWRGYPEFPWWFIGSAHRDDPIWWEMTEYIGHAGIDFYLLNYRYVCQYVDIITATPKAVHQAHVRVAMTPIGEEERRQAFFAGLKARYEEKKRVG